MFGHDAGQLIDSWVRRLIAGTLEPEEEKKLLAAAAVLGANFDGYQTAADAKEKIEILRRWEHVQERYLLKPMNCPHHIQIYKAEPRSYRDLPVRLAEFGTVYRYEQSGELNGMLRVRGFTQDDAHLFCTPEQVEDEFRGHARPGEVRAHGRPEDYRVPRRLRDPDSDKYVGAPENWHKAEAGSARVLAEARACHYVEALGEAAFYGPKIDFMVTRLPRPRMAARHGAARLQPPRAVPARIHRGRQPAHRPVMIHRAPFGSMERFVGVLIEHFAGAFPLWLAPEQVRVLPLSDKSLDYAQDVERQFHAVMDSSKPGCF